MYRIIFIINYNPHIYLMESFHLNLVQNYTERIQT